MSYSPPPSEPGRASTERAHNSFPVGAVALAAAILVLSLIMKLAYGTLGAHEQNIIDLQAVEAKFESPSWAWTNRSGIVVEKLAEGSLSVYRDAEMYRT